MPGTLTIETIESAALRANPLGDPAVRRVAVWLPPSYESSRERRYPVIYWLAGYTGTGEMMFQGSPWQPGLGERLDRLVGGARDGRGHRRRARRVHALGGGQYLDSPSSGAYETPHRERGHPGDRRALPHASRRARRAASAANRRAASARWCWRCATPTLFSAVACHSGDAYFELSVIPDIPKTVRTLRRHGGVEGFLRYFAATEAKRPDDITTMMMLALGACYSPDAGAAAGHRAALRPRAPARSTGRSGGAGKPGIRSRWSRRTRARCAR